MIRHTYIYIYACWLWIYYLGQVWPFEGLLSGSSKGYYLGQGDFGPMFIVVSGDFLQTQLSFCVLGGAQLSGNFLQIGFLKKWCKFCFFFLRFLCCKLFYCFSFFLGWQKNYKNRGVSKCLCFLLFKEKKKANKNDNWNFWIRPFCPKMAVSSHIAVFQKMACRNPYFYGVFGGCAFWAKFSKKGNFGTPKIKIDNFDC